MGGSIVGAFTAKALAQILSERDRRNPAESGDFAVHDIDEVNELIYVCDAW
jgi:hypothetical protein